ncbi:UvrD-helicase domain-containing protein [Bacillus altitudinis]|uniref:UvrD-helicase domain-containing protein n=1 Tax=Bacillus altitudinis TaxID=293387 RepID=UPI0002D4D4D0
MQLKNKVIVAAAGSGKTTYIVKEALNNTPKKTLIVTYTNKNREEIEKKIIELNGFIPNHIMVKSWYTFLLSDLIRPYQNFVYEEFIEGVYFPAGPINRFATKTNIKAYFLNAKNEVNKDRLSELAELIAQNTEYKNINRISELYDSIFIDEVQDMAGYDLEIFNFLMHSTINVLFVGDIRQATYATNNTNKNKKYKGINIIDYFLERTNICEVDQSLNISHRCNQLICDFADSLFESMASTVSTNEERTGHDGVFIVHPNNLEEYIQRYNPQCLRYDARTVLPKAINFGDSKGLTFDRVLIKPTVKMEKYMESGELDLDETTLAKFYVALTRAKYSVGIISATEKVKIKNICNFKE